MHRLFLAVLLATIFSSSPGLASCRTDSELKGSIEPAELNLLERLKGTVAMYGTSSCSGALVTFKGRHSSARALVLSAAHCSETGKMQLQVSGKLHSYPEPGEVLYRFEYRRAMTLDTGNKGEPRICAEADQIIYGTTTGADIMLLRLSETYEEIEKRSGVKPFMVSQDTSIPDGTMLRMPSSRWQDDRLCQVEATIPVIKEGPWVWEPVLRLRRMNPDTCSARPGASGAPAISALTNEIIGVLGTVRTGDGEDCSFNNPCEVNPGAKSTSAVNGQVYVHFVHKFYTCLNEERDVSLDVPGCPLPKPQR